VARGAAPLLVAGGGAVFAGEVLSPAALAGLLLASLAIASFAFERGLATPRQTKPFVFGLVTAVFISCYTVTDALGVRVSGSPLGFIAWLFLISGVPLVGYVLIARLLEGGAARRYDLRARLRPGDLGADLRRHGACLGFARDQRRLRRALGLDHARRAVRRPARRGRAAGRARNHDHAPCGLSAG
jgi:hypothetical protein